MTSADRKHAAQQLLAFLERVGPLEAIWAMTIAVEALQAPGALASGDPLAAAVRAFDEAAAAETNELSAVQPPEAAPANGAAKPAVAPPAKPKASSRREAQETE